MRAAVTVTVSLALSSATVDGLADRVMAWLSSSVRVTVVPVTVELGLVPDKPMVSLPSTNVSWVGVSVNVAVPVFTAVCEFAGIVIVKSATVA